MNAQSQFARPFPPGVCAIGGRRSLLLASAATQLAYGETGRHGAGLGCSEWFLPLIDASLYLAGRANARSFRAKRTPYVPDDGFEDI